MYLSTNVMLSAISATRFAILPAMMAYAELPPPCAGLSPATDAALAFAGVALCCAGLTAPLTDFAGAFFAGARGVAGFLGVAPFIAGRCTCVAIFVVLFRFLVDHVRAGKQGSRGLSAGRLEVAVSFFASSRFHDFKVRTD